MEIGKQTNKRNIRTKHSTTDNVASKVWSSSLFMSLLIVIVPQLALSSALPSSSFALTDDSVSVLRIDSSAAQIHLRLGAPLPPLSITGDSSSRVANSSPKSDPIHQEHLPNGVRVRPTFSSIACDEDIVKPLDVVSYANGVLIVSYANVVAFESGKHDVYLCVTDGGKFHHLGETSRFEVIR